MRKNKGFTLIELMIVIAIIAVIAAIAIPGLLQAQRASNERNASTSLKTIASAEADFRSNDRDGNKVNDFWIGDVSGLYRLNSWATEGGTNEPIKLIEITIAGADADDLGAAPGNGVDISTLTIQQPKAGYWYYAMISDNSGPTNVAYAQTSQGLNNLGQAHGGNNHNTSKFGFGTYPASGSTGKSMFFINEGNTMFKHAVSIDVNPAPANIPPGNPKNSGGIVSTSWPTDALLRTEYAKMD